MEHETKWYEERRKWKETTPEAIPANGPDIYRPSELTMEVCDMIGDVIVSTKGPYEPF